MKTIRWASYQSGVYRLNGRKAGPRAVAMLKLLLDVNTDVDTDKVFAKWYRLPRLREAYAAKQRRHR